ncbi:MAG: polymer-forming cytoskeletal protein [Pseudomonadota bacterium]
MFRRREQAAGDGHRQPAEPVPAMAELPRRTLDLPVASQTAPAMLDRGFHDVPAAVGVPARQLVVGAGIELKGEITGCERLLVQGDVEATLHSTDHLVIAEGGRFEGRCEVETAEIAGRYEGDLEVRGRLFVKATGAVFGSIRFGELEVSRGGEVGGKLEAIRPATSDVAPIVHAAIQGE